VDASDSREILEHLQSLGEEAYEIGTVQKGIEEVVFKKE
jgi:phosphoribosylformylglycinamidine cyclo-ligase